MSKTIDEQIKCAQRELGMRKMVYPRRVAEGKMLPQTAQHETDCMAAILQTLEQVKKQPQLL